MKKQEKIKITNPRVLIACKASVDRGVVHGKWIDATRPIQEIQREITSILKSSPEGGTDGWVINRYEGFYGIKIERTLESITGIAASIKKRGRAFAEFIKSVYTGDKEGSLRSFDSRYIGTYGNFEAAGIKNTKFFQWLQKKLGDRLTLWVINVIGRVRYVSSGTGDSFVLYGFRKK